MDLQENPINIQIIELLQKLIGSSGYLDAPSVEQVSSILEFAGNNQQFLNAPGQASPMVNDLTPLALAMSFFGSDSGLFKGLVDLDADPFAWDARGNTLLSYAAAPTSIYRYNHHQGPELFNDLLRRLDGQPERQRILDAALGYAIIHLDNRHCQNYDENMIIRLIEKGADPDLKLSDWPTRGSTVSVVQFAMAHMHPAVALKLIAAGANHDATLLLQDATDVLEIMAGSPEHFRHVVPGFKDIIKALVAKGADLYASDFKGRTSYNSLRSAGIEFLILKPTKSSAPRLEL